MVDDWTKQATLATHLWYFISRPSGRLFLLYLYCFIETQALSSTLCAWLSSVTILLSPPQAPTFTLSSQESLPFTPVNSQQPAASFTSFLRLENKANSASCLSRVYKNPLVSCSTLPFEFQQLFRSPTNSAPFGILRSSIQDWDYARPGASTWICFRPFSHSLFWYNLTDYC